MSRHAPSASIETLRGVGPALRDKFAKLHIHTLLDLLLNLPHRYQDRTQVTPLIGLRAKFVSAVTVSFATCSKAPPAAVTTARRFLKTW